MRKDPLLFKKWIFRDDQPVRDDEHRYFVTINQFVMTNVDLYFVTINQFVMTNVDIS